LAEMRKKVAAIDAPLAADPASTQAVSSTTIATDTPTSTPEESVAAEPLLCPTYQLYGGSWIPAGLSIEVVEGARLVTRQRPPSASVSASGTLALAPDRVVLLQLPIRLSPSATPSCLPSDVVGIATDGSLIRNGEGGLYGVFGAETLIGYALDGFPIYGMHDIRGDICGGAVVAGQYRYHLSSTRDTILNCFSAPPISVP
jgi:hypothetical protein